MGKTTKTILLIDDDLDMHTICKKYIEKSGYRFISALNGKEGLEKIRNSKVDLVLLDFMMPEMDGYEFYQQLMSDPRYHEYRAIPVIMLTIMAENQTLKDRLLKMGLTLYLPKPFGFKELITIIDNVLAAQPIKLKQREQEEKTLQQARRLAHENRILRSQIKETYGFGNIIGANPVMREIFEKILKVANTDANVFIYGESGTGKELIARSIHIHSHRRHKAFIALDCVALPPTLMESELFGYEKGAFTGAVTPRSGLLELAHQGTFFLDEICELPCDLQAKLLRVLQERQFRRIGGEKLIEVDIRIVSATNQNPEHALAKNKLRADLYYRLNVIPIVLPPLRERCEDIPLLVHHFMHKFCRANNKQPMKISKEAMDLLKKYHWPGNVRELQNIMERMVSLNYDTIITPEDLPEEIRKNSDTSLSTFSADLPLRQAKKQWLAQFERAYLEELLLKCNGNISHVAKLAQVNRMTIYRMLKAYNMSAKDFLKR